MPEKIAIIGFGETGVLTAARLSKKYDITAISTKPLLVSGQELGARLTRLSEWEENYLLSFSQIRKLEHVDIIHGKAASIDPVLKQVTFTRPDGQADSTAYDVLIIASGATNGFWRDDKLLTENDVRSTLETGARKIEKGQNLAIIGGGPSGISTASNFKEIHPDKSVHLFFSGEQLLNGYPEKTQTFAKERLQAQGVNLYKNHRARMPKTPLKFLEPGNIEFETGQASFQADCILWAIGHVRPNSGFMPENLLDGDGFVRVNEYLQLPDHEDIFAIGDIAASDPHRSSARNMGYDLLAANIDKFLSGRPQKMKIFKPPTYRWGSVFGIQNEGLRIFTAKGQSIRINPWTVKKLLYPLAVDRMIYRGISRDK